MLNSETLIETYPGYMVLKDTESVIVSANQRLSQIVGYQDIRDYLGRTDYDIKSAAVECADDFIKQDKAVMKSNKAISFLDFSIQNQEPIAMIKIKSPWHTKGKLNGTISTAIKLQTELNKTVLNHVLAIDKAQCIHKTYQLKQSYDDYGLSQRESHVLFLLMRGRTAKRIAQSLSISHRTVESHINAIKQKMQCQTKAELIDKALTSQLGNTLLLSLLTLQ